MKKLWFRNKTYGWGWYPATWEGWLVLAVFIGVIVWNFFRIDGGAHSINESMLEWAPQTVALVLVLLVVCYLTGEKPSWQWGEKKDSAS